MKRRAFLTLLAVGSVAGLAVAGGPQRASYHNVTDLAFAPDGHTLLVSNVEGASQAWKLPSMDLQENLGPFFRAVVARFAFSPDGHLLAVGTLDTRVSVYDWKKRKKLFDVRAAGADLTSMSFSPDGRSLAVGTFNQHGAVVDMRSQGLLGSFNGSVAAFSPDNTMLAVGGTSGQVQILDLKGIKPKAAMAVSPGFVVNALAFSPLGDLLAVGCGDKKIYLYQTATWKVLQTLEGHGAVVTSLAFLPGGKALLSSALQPECRLWSGVAGKWDSKVLHGHKWGVMFVDASRDGKYLATGAIDGSVCLWTPDGTLVKQRLIRPLQK